MAELLWLGTRAARYHMRPWQALLVIAGAMLLYSTPMLLNGYLYIDDNIRSVFAATNWAREGRPVGDYLLHALTLSPGAPNVFPLTLFVAILALAYASMRLGRHWFGRPTVVQCLILLPLWYNPFYLQTLSYQYDAFAVSLALAFIILSFTYCHRSRLCNWLVRSALLAAALNVNQLALNFFLGLACVDHLVWANRMPAGWRKRLWPLEHVGTLIGAGVLYLCTGYRSLSDDRGGFSIPPLSVMWARAGHILDDVLLFISPTNAAVFIGLLALAIAGAGVVAWRVYCAPGSVWARAVRLGQLLLALLGTVLAVPGILLVLVSFENNDSARLLIGVSPFLVGLLLLAHMALSRWRPEWGLVLVLPLYCFLVFAYAHGQVIRDKATMQTFARTSVTLDLMNNPALQSAKSIYFVDGSLLGWFSSQCVERSYPAMAYVVNIRFAFLPEELVKFGFPLSQFHGVPQLPSGIKPWLVRPYYRIYLDGPNAYVEATPPSPEFPCGGTAH